jgi:hypothetical protein
MKKNIIFLFYWPSILCAVGAQNDSLVPIKTVLPPLEVTPSSILTSYNIDIQPIAKLKCTLDVFRELLASESEFEKDCDWRMLAVKFCCDHCLNEVYSACRKRMLFAPVLSLQSNNLSLCDLIIQDQQKFLVEFVAIPIAIITALYAIHTILKLLDVPKQSVWFIVDQTFQILLLARNVFDQCQDFRAIVGKNASGNQTNVLKAFNLLLVKAVLRNHQRLGNILMYALGFEAADLTDDYTMNITPASGRDFIQILHVASLFLSFKLMKHLTFFKSSLWMWNGVKLLESYVTAACWKIFYIATGQIKKPEEELPTTLEYRLPGQATLADLAKNFFDENPLVIRILLQTLIVRNFSNIIGFRGALRLANQVNLLYAIWQNNKDSSIQLLAKDIVGYDAVALANAYSLVRTVMPILPDISTIIGGSQKLLFTIVYPEAFRPRV